jgi:hypothetical protein
MGMDQLGLLSERDLSFAVFVIQRTSTSLSIAAAVEEQVHAISGPGVEFDIGHRLPEAERAILRQR